MNPKNTQSTPGLASETGSIEPIETHTDGSKWIKCTAAEPKPGKKWNGIHVYHGDAKVDRTGNYGSDDHYTCPHCNGSWWVEYDG